MGWKLVGSFAGGHGVLLKFTEIRRAAGRASAQSSKEILLVCASTSTAVVCTRVCAEQTGDICVHGVC